MRTQNILLVSLFISLYGCQPEAPKPTAAAPAESSALPAEAGPAAQPVASEAPAPVQQIEPVSAEKAVQAREKIAAAVKEQAPQPAAAEKPAPAPAAAPVAAEVKPAAKSEPAVSEADFMQLAKKGNCLACHSADKKVVGPSFRDVAAKYRGDAGAEARLADKIAKGGGGVWGAMAMPASPKIGEADRITLARYVLSLK